MCDNLPSDEIFGFEGPEKKLEIDFKHSKHASLSHVEKDEWQRMLDEAKCTIISTMKNDHCTCFVLSESSLFVYPFKVIIKTCGTTTLLKCIPVLLEIAKGLDLEVDFLWFSRKNLNFPEKQLFPHSCFEEETEYLNDHFHGKSYILGPKDRDHWYLYIADLSDKNNGFDKQHAAKTDVTMEVLMHDMPVSVTQQFVRSDDFVDAKTTTKTSGIADLLPNSMIDDFAFDPCGYSMNGLLDEAYWTIHITPEQHCSFVSFETNFVFSSAEAYQKLLQKVIDTFRPGRVTTTLFADEAGELEHKTHYAFPEEMDGHAGSHYELLNKTYTEFEGKCGYNLTLCNYVLRPSAEGER